MNRVRAVLWAMLAIVLLLPVAVVKIILIVVGLIAVPITSPTSGLYRAGPGRPMTYWERAIRNPVGGFGWLIPHPPSTLTKTYGSVSEPTSESPRFQWRFKRSRFPLCSFRVVWRYSAAKYGECYVGWKLDSAPPELDFALSLRPYATIGQ